MYLELELPTYDGGELPVQIQMELNWFMPEELGEHTIPLKAELLSTWRPWLSYWNSRSSIIWGAEYEDWSLHSSLEDHSVPCAVCYISTRTSVVMIPAKTQCPSSWIREYCGYLTAQSDSHYRSSYECVDSSPEATPGSSSHHNGALFYYIGGTCNGLAYPPYESSRILSCIVCTK